METNGSDFAYIKQIHDEEAEPGSATISQAHCDRLVEAGYAEGDYVNGYRLSEAGRQYFSKNFA